MGKVITMSTLNTINYITFYYLIVAEYLTLCREIIVERISIQIFMQDKLVDSVNQKTYIYLKLGSRHIWISWKIYFLVAICVLIYCVTTFYCLTHLLLNTYDMIQLRSTYINWHNIFCIKCKYQSLTLYIW